MDKENTQVAEGSSYGKIQSCLDQLIGKIGSDRTTILLESFLGNLTLNENDSSNLKLLLDYLVKKAINLFELEEPFFYESNVRDYREARMCCFHLLRKYTSDTFSKIALAFRCSERTVSYGCQVTEERLNLPKFNKNFVARYTALESNIINYIGKIN